VHKGADLRYDITISLREAAFGKEKEIEMTSTLTAKPAGGTGVKAGQSKQTCSAAEAGAGHHTQAFLPSAQHARAAAVRRDYHPPCKDCRGGRAWSRPVSSSKVKIPAGWNSIRLKLSGEGSRRARGPAGDLYVVLHVEPDSFFERQGNDILCQIPISFPRLPWAHTSKCYAHGHEKIHHTAPEPKPARRLP